MRIPLLLLLLATPALAQPAETRDAVRIEAVAQVKEAARARADRIGWVHRNEVYAVMARSPGWVQIQFARRRGWVPSGVTKAVDGRVVTIAADQQLVRLGPAARFRAVGTLHRGDRVAVVGADGDWKKIFYHGLVVWLRDTYLASGQLDTDRSRRGFMQLPASGPGFVSYAVSSRRWGTPNMVYGLIRTGLRWRELHPRAGRIRIGDISLQNGGDISGHASHEQGRDVDVAPQRRDRAEAPTSVGYASYSRSLTADLIAEMKRQLPETLVLFNDRSIRGTTPWPNHSNHFHLRIR
jgi:uncharacterized protein YraI